MTNSDRKRIVVTGLGIISPLGIGKDVYWENVLSGKHGIDKLEFRGVDGEKTIYAGIINDFKDRDYVAHRKSLKVMSRDIKIAVGGAKLAIEDSGIDLEAFDPAELGVCIGAGMIHTDLDVLGYPISQSVENGSFSMKKFGSTGQELLFPLWLLKQLPNMLASHISIIFNAQGPSNSLTTASAAGLQSVGEAVRIIERGDAVRFICGGADSRVHPLHVIKYEMLGLSTSRADVDVSEIFCPYDKKRSGFIPAEASSIIFIETLESAKQRGVAIYGEIIGYGSSAGVSFYEKDADKRSYIESISISHAIKDARISPDDIDCVIGHGYSSSIDDLAETKAYKRVFGDRAKKIPVTSPNSQIGYCGAAAGSFGLIYAMLAMRNNKLTPTLFLNDNDPECDLNFIKGKPIDIEINRALVNVFDFHGQGASVIVKKYTE
ncbi:beta-ketoacyl-[acyl-carrier-protein] synthase family protein [bacterium]|nr:beta-ketoacyl-[acyl-carrier-protein] synthase family protein [bacterium]